MRVLVTGGCGYIGSHTVLELLERGDTVCSVDDHSNSAPESAARVARLAGRPFASRKVDLTDRPALMAVFAAFRPELVVHFAGRKAVGESTARPLLYYEKNVQASLTLLQVMEAVRCRRIVFSSSATVYGEPRSLPVGEAHPLYPASPYGRTKLFIEQMIRDWAAATPGAAATLLRYFNPVGAHASGAIGEDPRGTPNNLMPLVAQVAAGRRPHLTVYGDDYETPDGTGVRDYIHVVDLARAHLAALDFCARHTGAVAINVGTGRGTSVLELVGAFSRASGRPVPCRLAPRRPGDVAISVAEVERARRLLGWTARHDIASACRSAWNWQQRNPLGYRTPAGEPAAAHEAVG